MTHDRPAASRISARSAIRVLGLLLLGCLIPACYSASGTTYTPPGTPGGSGSPGVLLSDNFVTFPAPHWTTPPTATVNITNPFTPPNYFLTLTDIARPGSTSTTTTMSFTSQNLTFSVGVFYSAASASMDTASVAIVDGTSTVLAQATLNAMTGMMSFQIGSTSLGPVAVSAGTFHTATFKVNAATNTATWNVDATSTGSHAFGPATTKLELSASYASAVNPAPTFKFASVSVSDP